jgi:hypothetical protein
LKAGSIGARSCLYLDLAWTRPASPVTRVQRLHRPLTLSVRARGAHDGVDWRHIRIGRGGFVTIDAGPVDAVVAHLMVDEQRGVRP